MHVWRTTGEQMSNPPSGLDPTASLALAPPQASPLHQGSAPLRPLPPLQPLLPLFGRRPRPPTLRAPCCSPAGSVVRAALGGVKGLEEWIVLPLFGRRPLTPRMPCCAPVECVWLSACGVGGKGQCEGHAWCEGHGEERTTQAAHLHRQTPTSHGNERGRMGTPSCGLKDAPITHLHCMR